MASCSVRALPSWSSGSPLACRVPNPQSGAVRIPNQEVESLREQNVNGAVRVNINNQQTAVFARQQPHSFEEAMDRIRELHLRESEVDTQQFRSPADHARDIRPGQLTARGLAELKIRPKIQNS